jgi:hypothetical protein
MQHFQMPLGPTAVLAHPLREIPKEEYHLLEFSLVYRH